METQSLTKLKIHKLSKAQFDREKTNDELESGSLYLTPAGTLTLKRGSTTIGTFDGTEDKSLDLAHTYTASITDGGSSAKTLAHNSTYTLTAGGSSVAFKLPADNNTTYTFATGDNVGQFKVTPSSGSATNVTINGFNATNKTLSLTGSDNPYIKLQDNTTNGVAYYLQVSSNELGFGPTWASAVRFDKDGNLTLNATNATLKAPTFVATSDKRLKENIKPYSCEKSILELPVYSYNFIADETKTKHIGCMAQDLQEICPELIREDSEGYLSINESKIVYLLLEEVKKLKTEIDELKAKN